MKILVAEDNPDSRQLVTDIIIAMGHEPVASNDGREALQDIHFHLPDLAILDVDMPGINGFDLCQIIKRDVKTSHIPVLMLTARADVENKVHGLGLGADDYLSKPFNPRELMARIETRLRAKHESDHLRSNQEMILQTFSRFVSASVVDQLLNDPSLVRLGGTLQEVTVLFADLEGFTALSENLHPEKLLSILNKYHALVVNIIQGYQGTIDKFLGDGVMALFNTPLQQPNHAQLAVEAALAIRHQLSQFHAQVEPQERMKINFGIHTGMAVVGNVGTLDIMNYTAVGDTVNLASRLQDLSHNSQILISDATYNLVHDRIKANEIGKIHVKNRVEAVMTYEVLEIAIE